MVFQNFGLSWIIELKDQLKFDFEHRCPICIINGTWYTSMICYHFHHASFEEYFTTAQKCRYNAMCSIEAYGKLHQTCTDSSISSDVILLINWLTIYVLML